MGITFGKGETQSGSGGSSVKMADGVFIDKGVITAAQVEYGAKKYESWKPVDVAVKLQLAVEGLDFTKDLWIGGNFRKDGTPQGGQVVTGVGGAFKVLRVFDELGIIGEIDDQGRFTDPHGIVDALQGRELFYLQYVAYKKDNGKPGYRDFEIIAGQQAGESEDDVRARLFDTWRFDSYMQKDFKPEYLKDEEQTSFNYGANANGGTDPSAALYGTAEDTVPKNSVF